MPKTLNPEEIAAFRDRLCDIAERLFAERGADAVTVRELATELGVSPMTPYRYFADKDAMLAAVRARAFDRFAAVMEAAFERRSWVRGAGQSLSRLRPGPPRRLPDDVRRRSADLHPVS